MRGSLFWYLCKGGCGRGYKGLAPHEKSRQNRHSNAEFRHLAFAQVLGAAVDDFLTALK